MSPRSSLVPDTDQPDQPPTSSSPTPSSAPTPPPAKDQRYVIIRYNNEGKLLFYKVLNPRLHGESPFRYEIIINARRANGSAP